MVQWSNVDILPDISLAKNVIDLRNPGYTASCPNQFSIRLWKNQHWHVQGDQKVNLSYQIATFTWFMFSDRVCMFTAKKLFFSTVIPKVRCQQAYQNPMGICHKGKCLHDIQVPSCQKVEGLGTKFDASINKVYRYDAHSYSYFRPLFPNSYWNTTETKY